MTSPLVIKVALDTPVRGPFDYLPLDSPVAVGARVRVPFGRRLMIGFVTGSATYSDVPASKLRRIAEVLDTEPVLPASLRSLCEWASEYYHFPLGSVLAAALPRLLRDGARADALTEYWAATAAGHAALADGTLARAPRQLRFLAALAAHGRLDAAGLQSLDPAWRERLRTLRGRALVTSGLEPVEPPGATDKRSRPADALRPSTEQRLAVEHVVDRLGSYAAVLLDGVTGSGKTEVYLQVIDEVLARGDSALVLCPEIGLTPQLISRFQDRFAVPLAVLHSALTDRQRLAAWRTAASGEARIVIGTRSAVFAPLPRLGIIVIDEEHDPSFKQQEGGFRYSARDLALVRGQKAGVPVLLGSATPSLETLHNAHLGKATRLRLPRRAGAAAPPTLQLIDLRAHAVHRGLSAPLSAAMQRHLDSGGQVLIYLNRRGYAPTLLCQGCGWVAPCKHCDARMTVHLRQQHLCCHHCGTVSELPTQCPRCGYPVKPLGHGTERVEETLLERFPGVPLVRFDRDNLRQANDLAQALDRVTSGEARILVGTQMLTKGHHFPEVSLVGILNADQSLFSTDFRAAERLAQTIVQVAGRAGRATRAGEVMIQTQFPSHPLLLSLLAEGYDGFAEQALEERRAAGWPPFGRLAMLRASGTAPDAALAFLSQARALAIPPPGVALRGPVPAAMVRRAGRYFAQLLIESAERPLLQHFLGDWLPRVETLPLRQGQRWALDVDPLEVF